MANRYWVAATASNWNNTANWSTSSGGSSGASVPGASDTAIFNSNGIGKCTLDMSITVATLTLGGGYTGAGADDGHFDCDGFDVTITSSSHVAFSNKTVTFSDGTTTVWTFGQGFNARSSSASFANLTTCTWRFTGSGTFDGHYSKKVNKVLVENGANVLSNWGFTCTNLEVSGRLRTKVNSPRIDSISSGSELRLNSTGVIEFTDYRSAVDVFPSSGSSSVVNIYIDGTFDGPDRYNGSAGLHVQSGTVNIYATAPIDCTYKMMTPNNVSGNVHRLQTATTFNYFVVDHHWSQTITFDQNNYDVTFVGDVTFFESGKPTAWIPGTGSVILAPTSPVDINFDGKTIGPLFYSDNAVSTATLQANVTTPYVHDCANQIDENGYTVTTTGTDPSPCSTGARYWVGLVDTDYENTGNWSASSGGLGNASVPVGTNDVIFDGNGLVNCTMTNNRFANTLDVQTAYVNTFSLASFTLSVAGNATADSNLAVSTGTLRCQGDVDIYPLQASGGTLTLDGSAQVLTLGGNSANVVTDLNIDGSTVTTANNGPSRNVASGAWVVNNGGSFTYSGGLGCNSISVGSGSFVTQTANTTTVDTGGIPQNDGYIDIVALKHSNQNNGTYYWDAGDYRNTHLTLEGNNETHTFGTGVVKIKSLTVNAGRSGRSATIANTTNDPNFEFSGSVNLNPTTGSVVWNAGDGTIILNNVVSQSIDFNGQTVEGIHVTDASTGSIVLANSFSTAWLRDCNSLIDLNGYTITNADTEDRCAYPYDPPTTIALDSSKAINTDQQLWLPMLAVSGATTSDLSGNGNDGTLDASLSHMVTTLGGAIKFPTNGSVDSSVTISNQPITISVWAYPTTLPTTGTNPKTICSGQSSAGRTEILIVNTGSSIVARLYSGMVSGSHTYLPGITQISADEWVHVVGVFNGSSSELYVNGSLDATGPLGSYALISGLRIGELYNNIYDFPGRMQNFRIWSRALTSTEVASLYSDPWIGSDYTAVVPLTNRYFAPAAFRRLG